MALKSTELRSGNLVYGHNGQITKVTGYNILSLEDKEAGLHHDPRYKDWRGIELDSEKLISLGGLRKGTDIIIVLNARMYLWFNDGNPFQMDLIQDEKRISFAHGQAGLMHQLQNLVHSLTGNELEIKL